LKKSGSSARATFVSPYLRRPLRPLEKVIGDREVAEKVYEEDAGASEAVVPAVGAWDPERTRFGDPD